MPTRLLNIYNTYFEAKGRLIQRASIEQNESKKATTKLRIIDLTNLPKSA